MENDLSKFNKIMDFFLNNLDQRLLSLEKKSSSQNLEIKAMGIKTSDLLKKFKGNQAHEDLINEEKNLLSLTIEYIKSLDESNNSNIELEESKHDLVPRLEEQKIRGDNFVRLSIFPSRMIKTSYSQSPKRDYKNRSDQHINQKVNSNQKEQLLDVKKSLEMKPKEKYPTQESYVKNYIKRKSYTENMFKNNNTSQIKVFSGRGIKIDES